MSSPRSNIHGLKITFLLQEKRDIDCVEVETGFPRKKLEKIIINEKGKPTKLEILKDANIDDLKNGLIINARLKFLFNIADEVIAKKIKFHYFCELKKEYQICNPQNPAVTLQQKPQFKFQVTPILCKPQLEFQFEEGKGAIEVTKNSLTFSFPRGLLKKFERSGNSRFSQGRLSFHTDTGKALVNAVVCSYRVERTNAAEMNKGGYWKGVTIIGPRNMDPPIMVKRKARESFLEYLQKELLNLQEKGYEITEVLERINAIKSGNQEIKQKTEHQMQRYGASSKKRMIADILNIELDLNNNIQLLVDDVTQTVNNIYKKIYDD